MVIFIKYTLRFCTCRKIVKKNSNKNLYYFKYVTNLVRDPPPKNFSKLFHMEIFYFVETPSPLWHISLNPQVFYTCPNDRSQSGHCNNEWPLLGGLFSITIISSIHI